MTVEREKFHGSVLAQWHGRRRPVYLAQWHEAVNGIEDASAFHTLPEAKRWVLSATGRKRGVWSTQAHDDGTVYSWHVQFCSD